MTKAERIETRTRKGTKRIEAWGRRFDGPEVSPKWVGKAGTHPASAKRPKRSLSKAYLKAKGVL